MARRPKERRYQIPRNQGERNGAARLKQSEVVEIKEALRRGETHRALGRKHNCHHSTIGRIATGDSWRYV